MPRVLQSEGDRADRDVGASLGRRDSGVEPRTSRVWNCALTVSMRVMSSGDGVRYLRTSVAAGEGDRLLSTTLTRYYTEEGTPPGQWTGSGLSALGEGQLAVGDRVLEAQFQMPIGTGRDPVTAASLGRPYPVFRGVAERVAERVAVLDPALSAEARARAETAIEVGNVLGVGVEQWRGSTSRSRCPSSHRCSGQ